MARIPATLLGLGLAACAGDLTRSDGAASGAAVTSVTVHPDSVRLAVSDVRQAVCEPRDEHGAVLTETCTWLAVNPAIATVTNEGQSSTVTVRASGTTLVIASAQGHADTLSLAAGAPSAAGPPPPDTATSGSPPSIACDPARPGLLFAGDFEPPLPWAGWDVSQAGAYAWSRQQVPSTTGGCAGAYHAELRRTDSLIAGSHRAQVQLPGLGGGLNAERWYGFSVFLPADWVIETGAAPDLLFEVLSGARSPFLSLNIGMTPEWTPAGDQWYIQSSSGHGPQNHPSWRSALYPGGPIVRDGWTDWVFHIVQRADAGGRLEVWRDGTQIVNVTGPVTWSDNTGSKPLWGLYKWSWNAGRAGGNSIVSRREALFDNVRVADERGSYALVAPRTRHP